MWIVLSIGALVLLALVLLYLLRPVYRPAYLLDLRDVHVVITGGSSGIGKELARQFLVDHQARVTILARNQNRLDECQRDLAPENNERLLCLSVDVSGSYADVQKAIAQACEYHDNRPVSILINNAGIFYAKTVDATTPEDFENMGEHRVRSHPRLTRTFSSAYQLLGCCFLHQGLPGIDASTGFWPHRSPFLPGRSSGRVRIHIVLCHEIRSQRLRRIPADGTGS